MRIATSHDVPALSRCLFTPEEEERLAQRLGWSPAEGAIYEQERDTGLNPSEQERSLCANQASEHVLRFEYLGL